MKEIEVKARLKNKDMILKKLAELGCKLSEPIVQKDVVFISEGVDYNDMKEGDIFLRLRQQKEKTIFTLKQMRSNELDNLELEVEVTDSESMQKILENLDYHEAVRINKKRRKCKYKEYEICVDEVEELGSFIEVEKLCEGDGEEVQEELFRFLLSIGVKKEDRVLQGYDTMMFFKKS